MSWQPNPRIKVGEKFGCLEIIKVFQKQRMSCGELRNFRWIIIKCECGKTYERLAQTFLVSQTSPKECVCSVKPDSSQIRHQPSKCRKTLEEVLINNKVSDCSRNAAQKGFAYSLTFEEVKVMTFSNCTYCGHSGRNIFKYIRNQTVLHNGIDRVNNALGYITGNVVPCCWDCNRAKNKSTYAEFLEYLNLFKP